MGLDEFWQGLTGLVRFWQVLVGLGTSKGLSRSWQVLTGLAQFWYVKGSHWISLDLGGCRHLKESEQVLVG